MDYNYRFLKLEFLDIYEELTKLEMPSEEYHYILENSVLLVVKRVYEKLSIEYINEDIKVCLRNLMVKGYINEELYHDITNLLNTKRSFDEECGEVMYELSTWLVTEFGEEDYSLFMDSLTEKEKSIFKKYIYPKEISIEIVENEEENLKTLENILPYYEEEVEDEELSALINDGEDYYYGRNSKEKDLEKCFECFSEAADLGSSYAQSWIGYLYELGLGVEKDYDKALEWYKKSSLSDNAYSQWAIGMMYLSDKKPDNDYKMSLYWFTKSAENEYAPGQYQLANLYYDGDGVNQNYEEAFKYYSKSAAYGYSPSEFMLSTMYKNALGIEEDMVKAVYWCKKAAEHGYPPAQLIAGKILTQGFNIEQDKNKGIEFIEKAAEEGLTEAYNYLAELYEGNYGQEKDLNKVLDYYEKSTELNDIEGKLSLGLYKLYGYAGETDYKGAYEIFSELADKEKDPSAMVRLAIMYIEGYHVEKDLDKALELSIRACDLDYGSAYINAGYIYERKDFLKRDVNKALEFYNKACEKEMPEAFFNIAMLYRNGELGEINGVKAFEYFKKAADLGDLEAAAYAGDYLEYSYGVTPKDHHEAYRYYYMGYEYGLNQSSYAIGRFYKDGMVVKKDYKKAFDIFSSIYEKGYKYASAELGECYIFGYGVKQDVEKGIALLNQGMELENPRAFLIMGDCYQLGLGVKRKKSKAIDYYIQAFKKAEWDAALKLAENQYKLGGIIKKYSSIFRFLEVGADNGHGGCCFNLGILYYYGKGHRKDLRKSKEYILKACDYGIPEAENFYKLKFSKIGGSSIEATKISSGQYFVNILKK